MLTARRPTNARPPFDYKSRSILRLIGSCFDPTSFIDIGYNKRMRYFLLLLVSTVLVNGQILDFRSTPARDSRTQSFLSKRGIPSLSQRAVSVDVDELSRAAVIEFSLLDGKTYTARLAKFEARGESNSFYWHGKIDGGGDAMFTVRRGLVSAYIDSAAGIHQVVPTPDGGHALIQVKTEAFGQCTTKRDPAAAKFVATGRPHKPSDGTGLIPIDGDPIVDVTITYTAAAKDEAGGGDAMAVQVQAMIDSTNLSFQNSQLLMRVRLASTYESSYTAAELDKTLSFLDTLMNDPDIAARRDTDKADLVALITSRGEGEEDGCGKAFGLAADGSRAFSETKLSCAVGNLTFAHELGHNFGAEHDPTNGAAPEDAARPYAFGHNVNGKFRTVMSYDNQCADGCKRVPYWSNPDITYMDEATGIADKRDNARLLRETGPIVAKFRQQ